MSPLAPNCRTLLSCITLSLVAATSLHAQSTPGTGTAEIPVVTATGSAQVRIAPEQATLSIAIETLAPTASESARQNAAVTARVLGALQRNGFAGRDVSTTSYSVSQDRAYTPNGPQDRGYRAVNSVQVTVRQFPRLAVLIDSAVAAGATRIDNVHFTSSRADSARRAALRQAVADARQDAAVMAEAAGGHLGELLEVTNTTGVIGVRVAGGMAMGGSYFADAPPPPPPGTEIRVQDVVISAGVIARWRLAR